jgi:hypothetical protein
MTGFINNLLSVNKNDIPEREMNGQEGKNKGDGRMSDRIVGFINSVLKTEKWGLVSTLKRSTIGTFLGIEVSPALGM